MQATKLLINEITNAFSNLSQEIDENQVSKHGSSSKLVLNYWQSMQNIPDIQERKIRWCLIERSQSIEEELDRFYSSAVEYNGLFDRLIVLGKNRSEDDFNKLNALREKLKDDAYKIRNDLEGLQKKHV